MRVLASAGQSLLYAFAMLVHPGCVSPKVSTSPGWVHMSGEKALTPSQIREAEMAARAGDVSAGERLYRHYTFAGEQANTTKGNYWLKWLAERGVPYAAFNYGKAMIDEGKDPQQGLAWMIQAKTDGYSAGDELLRRYLSEYRPTSNGD